MNFGVILVFVIAACRNAQYSAGHFSGLLQFIQIIYIMNADASTYRRRSRGNSPWARPSVQVKWGHRISGCQHRQSRKCNGIMHFSKGDPTLMIMPFQTEKYTSTIYLSFITYVIWGGMRNLDRHCESTKMAAKFSFLWSRSGLPLANIFR